MIEEPVTAEQPPKAKAKGFGVEKDREKLAVTTYQLRLYPNANQERELLSQCETLRRVYNEAWDIYEQMYEYDSRTPTFNEIYRALCARRNRQVADRKAGGTGPNWLAKVNSAAVRDIILRVVNAYTRFFDGRSGKGPKTGRPKRKKAHKVISIPFKNYGDGCSLQKLVDRKPKSKKAAATQPPAKRAVTVKGDVDPARNGYRLRVVEVGTVRVNVHRRIEGRITTATVKRHPDGRWYVFLTAETQKPFVPYRTGPAIGIDMGLRQFVVTCDGTKYKPPKFFRKSLRKVRYLSRSVSRKFEALKATPKPEVGRRVEGVRLKKARHALARLHSRIARKRKEHRIKVARSLIDGIGHIAVERLGIKNMLKNSRLSRSINDAGWHRLKLEIRHQCNKAGVEFQEVNPRGTTQECSGCGNRVPKDLSVEWHNCPHCGCSLDRDHNSAINIRRRGYPDHLARQGPDRMPGLGNAGRNLDGPDARAKARAAATTEPPGCAGRNAKILSSPNQEANLRERRSGEAARRPGTTRPLAEPPATASEP